MAGAGYRMLSVVVPALVSCLLLWPLLLKTLRIGFFHMTDSAWAGDEAFKRQQPRFNITREELELVPTWVVSLESANDRRSAVLVNFDCENVTFQFVNAVSASSRLPADELDRFVSRKLQRATMHGRRAHIVRAETAAAISHLRLFVRMVQEAHPVVAQFEDDVVLLPDFKTELLQLFNQLPDDWDFLYLSECLKTDAWTPTGKPVGNGILTVRRGPCTTGFAYRASGAAKVLHHVQSYGLSTPFDVLLGNLAFAKKISMYTSPHRLARPSRVASTIQRSSHGVQTLTHFP